MTDEERGREFLRRVAGSEDVFALAGEALFDVLEVMIPVEEISVARCDALGCAIAVAAAWEEE